MWISKPHHFRLIFLPMCYRSHEHHDVWNDWELDCLLNSLFGLLTRKTFPCNDAIMCTPTYSWWFCVYALGRGSTHISTGEMGNYLADCDSLSYGFNHDFLLYGRLWTYLSITWLSITKRYFCDQSFCDASMSVVSFLIYTYFYFMIFALMP